MVTIAIASTFHAAPLRDPLTAEAQRRGLDVRIAFAPHDEFMRQLADDQSPFWHNQEGVNVILVRMEDWNNFERGDSDNSPWSHYALLHSRARTVTRTLETLAGEAQHRVVVCVCPISSQVKRRAQIAELLARACEEFLAALEDIPGASILRIAEADLSDAGGQPSDLPDDASYPPEFYARLSEMLVKRIVAISAAGSSGALVG